MLRLRQPSAKSATVERLAGRCGDADRKRKPIMTKIRFSLPAAGAEATADPEPWELRCPNGHDSAIRPRLPEVMFHACGHYRPTVVTWNEFCITCGVRHAPFRIYW